jgi:hypothetical protein
MERETQLSLINKEVWFKTGKLTNRRGVVKAWLYDYYYKIEDSENKDITGKPIIHIVYPEHIVEVIN